MKRAPSSKSRPVVEGGYGASEGHGSPAEPLVDPEAIAAAVARLLGEGAAMPLLDAEAAGAFLGVPSSWMLAEARGDRVPHLRLGRYVRFDRAELAAWRSARMRGPRRRTGSQPVSEASNGR